MTRVDIALVERGHFASRAKAREAIDAGLVSVSGRKITKPSEAIGADEPLESIAPYPWVSRGGVKLAAALDAFAISPAGKICLDIGASTGGFCDVLLSRGASRVIAVDVGHGQLHQRIAENERIVSLEKLDARALTAHNLDGLEPEIITFDVSFISLTLVLPAVLALAAPCASMTGLIKPQFEAGRDKTKKGIVRDSAVHDEVCAKVSAMIEQTGWRITGLIPSPLAGGDGNREFLIGAQRA